MEALLKASEAAALMGVSARWVQVMAKKGGYSNVRVQANSRGRDIYLIPLVNECISMFRNGIAVYVNGEIRGSWFVQDCEERRRFIPQKETSLMSRKQIAAYNKMPKKDRGLLKKFREKTFTAYQTHWTNWQALVKHFEANNADIRLVTPQ